MSNFIYEINIEMIRNDFRVTVIPKQPHLSSLNAINMTTLKRKKCLSELSCIGKVPFLN